MDACKKDIRALVSLAGCQLLCLGAFFYQGALSDGYIIYGILFYVVYRSHCLATNSSRGKKQIISVGIYT